MKPTCADLSQPRPTQFPEDGHECLCNCRDQLWVELRILERKIERMVKEWQDKDEAIWQLRRTVQRLKGGAE